MITCDDAVIEKMVVHRVGNKTNNEPLKISPAPFMIHGEIGGVLLKYFTSNFKSPQTYHLFSEAGVEHNLVYQCVRDIFADKNELFDYRTMGDQLSLNLNVYEYIEDKTSMLENDVKINFHVRCPDVSKKEQEIVRHVIKEHYAIELYKIQKVYTRYRNKAISLIFIGVISFIMYIFLFFQDGFDMFQEMFAFLFSFSLWEGFDSLIYNLSDTRYEVGNVTQNLLLEVVFMEDIKESEENIENII